MQKKSEIGHRATGVGLGLIAILAALDERTSDRIRLAHWGWPVGIVLSGLLIVAYLLSSDGSLSRTDHPATPQARRQMLIATLLAAGGNL
ncbi:MAG: hypothetical protein ACRDGN_11245 [bacterium]